MMAMRLSRNLALGRAGLVLVGLSAGLLLASSGCRRAKQQAASLPIETVCVECGKLVTTSSDKPAREQTWPRPCASCKKNGVYAVAGSCINCRNPVPARNQAGNGFGYPKRCPKCSKPWEP